MKTAAFHSLKCSTPDTGKKETSCQVSLDWNTSINGQSINTCFGRRLGLHFPSKQGLLGFGFFGASNEKAKINRIKTRWAPEIGDPELPKPPFQTAQNTTLVEVLSYALPTFREHSLGVQSL